LYLLTLLVCHSSVYDHWLLLLYLQTLCACPWSVCGPWLLLLYIQTLLVSSSSSSSV
jgi:vesicle coat complex subunit